MKFGSKKKQQEPEKEKPSFFTPKSSDQDGTEVEASSLFTWGKKEEPPAPVTKGRSFPWSKKEEEVPAAPVTKGRSLPWSKKEEEAPVAPVTKGRSLPWSKKQEEAPLAPVAPAAKERSFPWSKKQEAATVAPPPPPPEPVAPATPPRSSKFSFGKKSTNTSLSSKSVATAPPTPSPPRKNSSKRTEYDESFVNEKTRRKCCSCKCVIGSSCLLILLAIGGVLAWRYGPWFQGSSSSTNLQVESCPDCCNGLRSNCKLPVNKVLFPTLHNAHSSKDHKFIGASHEKQFENALVDGYRGLQLSTCTCENVLSNALLERDPALGLENSNMGFCHSACGTGVRDPKAVIENIKTFLDVNRREVLIVEIDMTDDSEDDLRTALRASGLLDHVYIPDSKYVDWPKMGKLVDKNKRLLLFGRGGSLRSCDAPDCRDGILYFYDFFAQTEPDGSDATSCDSTLNGDVNVDYFLVNQFQKNQAKMPSPTIANDLNSYNELSARFEDCQGKLEPNLLSVEFWQQGDVLEFVQKDNENRYELMKMGFGKRGLRG
eukprot:scaffold28099_cov106-Skeletonema_dohrnii-CCMP3373.AAC.3